MKKIKVAYKDFWDGFEPEDLTIHDILCNHYDVELSDDPEYVVCSIYSHECLNNDAIRIVYTGDNYIPDFNIYDYVIAFNDIKFGDRYVNVPNWLIGKKYWNDVCAMVHKHENVTDKDYDNRDFCAWVCSNGNGNNIREDMFHRLCNYKKVDSGGRFLNNIGIPNGVEDKTIFQKAYRFSFALEDSENDGYTDEKIVNCFASRNIPIFWGDRNVTNIFNKDAFISAYDYSSREEMVDAIIQLDSDKDEYLRRLAVPALKDVSYIERKQKELEAFLCRIVDQPYAEAYRRTESVWGEYMNHVFKRYETPEMGLGKKLFSKIKNIIS